MKYGVSVPNFGAYANPRTVAALAREAEAAGWDGFFLWDHIQFWRGFREPMADPWVALAAVAVATERIRLGPLVTPIARRRPWKLARETVTLDHLSGGRLILGVGLGFPPDAEFQMFGEDGDGRVRAGKLDEGLAILTGLWRGEPFSFQGAHFHVDEVTFQPRPVQAPRIPVWVAGMWPNRAPFRRAARWDGVAPMLRDATLDGALMTPDDLHAITDYIARQRGDAAGPFDVVLGGRTPGDDPAAGAATVAAYAGAGLTWWIEGCDPLRGTLDEMRRRIAQGPPRR